MQSMSRGPDELSDDVSAIRGEDRDAVTAKRSNPDLWTDLDRDCTRAKG